MRFITALVSFACLICPCALCYGQLSFSSVHGERGYSAMRGAYRWDLDNGLILTPIYGYYRMSDDEEGQSGSTSRYGLRTRYELTEDLDILAAGVWQPKAVGYQAVSYDTGAYWRPFYYWSGLKNPFVRLTVEQTRYRSMVSSNGKSLTETTGGQISTFREVETGGDLEAGAEYKNLNLKAQWHKVLKYSSKVPSGISFSWAELPYMTAVIQGFIKEAYAVKGSYKTDFLTPYATVVQYRYVERSDRALAVNAGVTFSLWQVQFMGGIEVFEPRRDENRRTFFSFSAEAEF